MTLRTFNQLNETSKSEEIALWGDLIVERIVSGHLVLFYKVHDFFVEVYLDPLHKQIKRYRACLNKL